MEDFPQPCTEFNWLIYSDATCAGLSILIPIPFLDWIFEEYFRRSISTTIARYRKRELAPLVIVAINKNTEADTGCLESCFVLPLLAFIELIKRLSRKILYFLTIKEATDKISYYWHLAFLIDYALLAGHLKDVESTRMAQQAISDVLQEISTNPLLILARQVIGGSRHIFRALRRLKRGREDELIQQKKSQMDQSWAEFEDYLKSLAVTYAQTYQKIKAGPDAAE